MAIRCPHPVTPGDDPPCGSIVFGLRNSAAAVSLVVEHEEQPAVDRAVAATTPFTEPFQDYITRCAWGDIWSRPGLSRAERSIVTLSVLAALQHEQELALHIRAALRNGLRVEQTQEVLLQVALYAGVPAGKRAFAIAQCILAEDPPQGH
jgi:alkylhydroperoxidase/carboxymuconolactone decarboxylase family protein YurZ